MKKFLLFILILLLGACCDGPGTAEGIFADLGEILPSANSEQQATFDRGKTIMARVFSKETGLGPTFNVASCMACHQKPVLGGSSARYRNFLFVGATNSDGTFTNKGTNGIQPQYSFNDETRVSTSSEINTIATRNSIPLFGVGLIADISNEEILSHADENDANGDEISGKPNFEGAAATNIVGRYGVKSQTASIEGLIRSQFFSHMGVTTLPLSSSKKALLPFAARSTQLFARFELASMANWFPSAFAQGILIPANSVDDDGVADPELSTSDLFDVVAATMLLAAPKPDEPTAQTNEGRSLFGSSGCTGCHIPALQSKHGGIPLFSDLLLHDMGSDLADGVQMVNATGSEFKTQPLWGVAATGPYLHDGRADTLDEAIRLHAGEAASSRNAYIALGDAKQLKVVAFLESLGGKSHKSDGLLAPDSPLPQEGEFGAPVTGLSNVELNQFVDGRAGFDQDHSIASGLGTKFNGDSCRACHFQPVMGGAGTVDVNVMRQGIVNTGVFTMPAGGTMASKLDVLGHVRPEPDSLSNHFEQRQTPPLFGLGLIDDLPDSAIIALEDPTDSNMDGIQGRARILPGGKLGKFGWKANVPSLAEFARDESSNEIGLSVPSHSELTFGSTTDSDSIADPEIAQSDLSLLTFFMKNLARPPGQSGDAVAIAAGAVIFNSVGCNGCHVEPSQLNNIPAYSDFLLHDVTPASFDGIEDGTDANKALMKEFRTPPLWGVSQTAPYMHNGKVGTLQGAIVAHEGEATTAVSAYGALSSDDKQKLIDFLNSL